MVKRDADARDEEERDVPTLSRRTFLQGMGIAMTCPLWTACEFVEVFDDEILGQATFDINEEQFSALQQVGATECLSAGSLSILLIRRDEDTVLAVDEICPHQRQKMGPCGNVDVMVARWDVEQEQLQCRWHGSIFAADGSVVQPAPGWANPEPLRVYPVDFDPATGQGVVHVIEENGNGEEQ